MRLLIAYDGSDGANAALDDLGRAGLPPAIEVLIVSVADLGGSHFVPGSEGLENSIAEAPASLSHAQNLVQAAVAEARALARHAHERLRVEHPEWHVQAEAAGGSPPEELIQKAMDWQSELLIVGSHGRSAIGQWLFGSVSQKILRYAPCSVRIARPRTVPAGRPVRLLVGTDGSTSAELAVRTVAARKWPPGSEARVVVALDLRLAVALPVTAEEDGDTEAEELAQRAVQELTLRGLSAVAAFQRGDPRKILLEEARQWDADGLFVGAKGRSGVARFLLGSVSATVAAHAPCSVEIVRG